MDLQSFVYVIGIICQIVFKPQQEVPSTSTFKEELMIQLGGWLTILIIVGISLKDFSDPFNMEYVGSYTTLPPWIEAFLFEKNNETLHTGVTTWWCPRYDSFKSVQFTQN